MNNDTNYEQMVCQHLVQVASEGVWLLDNDYRTIYVNPALARMLGVSIKSLKGANFFDFLHPDSKEVDEHFGVDQRAPRRELKFSRGDGTILWAIFSAVQMTDTRGNVIGLLGIVTDISDRKSVEDALWHSERRYHILMHRAADAIVVTDGIGDIIDVNRKAEILFGYGIDEFKGLNYVHLHPPENMNEVVVAFEKMQRTGEASVIDTQIIRKDGSRIPVDLSCSFTDIGGVKVAQAIMRDIRERKMYETDIKKRLDEYNILSRVLEQRDDEIVALKNRVKELKKLMGKGGDES